MPPALNVVALDFKRIAERSKFLFLLELKIVRVLEFREEVVLDEGVVPMATLS